MGAKDQVSWDAVVTEWQEEEPQILWRRHSDAVNAALVSGWTASDRVGYLLKTDSFDEAVGDGLHRLIASRAREPVGIDISRRCLRAARVRHADLRGGAADVRRLPFAEGQFDLIISNSTLDHFATRDEISVSLRELHRVLREGGQLLLTLDNLANPVILLRSVLPLRVLNRLGLVPYYVGATMGPRRLRETVELAGFTVLEVSATMHCPRILAVMMAGVLEKHATLELQRGFLAAMMAFERLARWPTRFLTGRFVAIRAFRPEGQGVVGNRRRQVTPSGK